MSNAFVYTLNQGELIPRVFRTVKVQVTFSKKRPDKKK